MPPKITAVATYRCAAGVNHHDRSTKVQAWKYAEQQRVAGDVADKVRAHDDYQNAVRLFRERIDSTLRDSIRSSDERMGYEAAVKDMDRAMMDVLRARQDEEEN